MKSIVLVLALVAGVFAVNENESFEHKLVQRLRASYPDPHWVRPVQDYTQAIDLKVAYSLLQINGLDPLKGTLDIGGMLIMSWTDQFLTWDPLDYGGVESMQFDASLIWIPPVSGWADHLESHKFKRAFVDHSGKVTFIQYARYGIKCEHVHGSEINDCAISFGTWTYHSGQVVINKAIHPMTGEESGVGTHHFKETRHWQLVNTASEIEESQFGPNTYRTMKVTLQVGHKTDGAGQPIGHVAGHGHHGSHEGVDSDEDHHATHHVH